MKQLPPLIPLLLGLLIAALALSIPGSTTPQQKTEPLPQTETSPISLHSLSLDPGDEDFDENEIYQGLPGLIAYWRNEAEGSVKSGVQPRLAFRFLKGESPRPGLKSRPIFGEFAGVLNVIRPGSYRFAATGAGWYRLRVGDHVVFEGELSDDSAPGEPLPLDYGPIDVYAEYRSADSRPALLQTYWQREDEAAEPIPAGSLRRHRAANAYIDDTLTRAATIFRQQRCDACHSPDADESSLVGGTAGAAPDLTKVSERLQPAWLYHWLKQPYSVQPASTMPECFDSQRPEDAVDLLAVVEYLGAGADDRRSGKPDQELLRQGETAFEQTGCIACHLKPGESLDSHVAGVLRPLDGVGSKYAPAALREKIADPKKHFPGGRMPNFQLQRDAPKHLEALTAYLAAARDPRWETLPDRPADFDDKVAARIKTLSKKDVGQKTADPIERLGEMVLHDRGCVNCHQTDAAKRSVAPAMMPFPAAGDHDSQMLACLETSVRPGVPRYDLPKETVDALIALLEAKMTRSPAAAPIAELPDRLERLGCVACHEWNGRGGVFSQRIAAFIPEGSDKTPRDLSPPSLSGIGEKLRPDWLHQVVVEGKRARPWMFLRMPEYTAAEVADLPDLLIRSDGADPDFVQSEPPSVSDDAIQTAREMVGRNVFNCVSCHDVLGHEGTGTRGPELAGIFSRVREPWFRRWLLDPQKISPGTRMPSIFAGGRSMAPQFLEGDPKTQIDALWAYFAKGEQMPMPPMKAPWEIAVAGGEDPRFTPTDRPLLLRGFMVEHAGLRAVAAGFPGGPHFSFDSEKCQLTRSWTGDFAEIGGWMDSGRGSPEDNGIKILGQIQWRFPDQFPIEIADETGDFQQPSRVRYDGCWIKADAVGFRYRLIEGDVEVVVEQRVSPLPSAGEGAFSVNFSLRSKSQGVRLRLLLGQLGPDDRIAFLSADGNGSPSEDLATASAVHWKRESGDWLIVNALSSAKWERKAGGNGESQDVELSIANVDADGEGVTLRFAPVGDDLPATLKSLAQ